MKGSLFSLCTKSDISFPSPPPYTSIRISQYWFIYIFINIVKVLLNWPWPVKGNIQTFVFKIFALCFELPHVFVCFVLETWWLWNLPIFIQLWKKSNGPFHKVIETFHQLSDFSKFLFVQGSKHLSRYWNNFQAPLTQKRLNIKSSSKWEFLREQKINLFKCQFYEALKTLYTYFWRVLHRNTEIHVVEMIPSNARSHQNVFQESQEIGVRLILSLGSE